MLTSILSKGKNVTPVMLKKVKSSKEVSDIFKAWVETEGAEELVVHCTMPQVFKIKPKRKTSLKRC